MKKRIFISTNYDRLRRVIGDQRDNKGIQLLNENNLLYWNPNSKSFQINLLMDASIFLVRDENYGNNNTPIDTLENIQIQQSDYLMRHSRYTHKIIDFGGRVNSKGQHEPRDPYYSKVFECILDDSINEKTEQIIEFLFPTSDIILGKKLNLLHNLLVPPADFVEANKKWEEIETTVESARASGINVSLATNEDALTTFQKAVNGINDPFNSVYINALADLRDAILSS